MAQRDLLQWCPISCIVGTLHKYQDFLPLYFLLQNLWFFSGYTCQLLYYEIRSGILCYSLHFFIPLVKTESVFQYHDDTLTYGRSGFDWPTDTKRRWSKKLFSASVGHCPELCRCHLTLVPLRRDGHEGEDEQQRMTLVPQYTSELHSWSWEKCEGREGSHSNPNSLWRGTPASTISVNISSDQKHVRCLHTGLQKQGRHVLIKQIQRQFPTSCISAQPPCQILNYSVSSPWSGFDSYQD